MTDLKKKTRELCRIYGIKPARELGQHFLVDAAVLDDIVRVAALPSLCAVIEIGPGFGVLTERLAEGSREVFAIELDAKLAQVLQGKFSAYPHVHVVHDDIFRWLRASTAVVASKPYAIVANLPYNIASHVLRVFLELSPKPVQMTVLLQKEVAERLTASAGDTSVLSIMAQAYANPRLVRTIAQSSFWPEPAVESALVVLDAPQWKFPQIAERDFFRVVKAGFSARRKKLVNNLAAVLRLSSDDAHHALSSAGIPRLARAQELTLEQWAELVLEISGLKTG